MNPVQSIKGGLIVSCQATRHTPLSNPNVLGLIAASVVGAGAVAIRAEGIPNLRAIRKAVAVPLIGLWKVDSDGPYITPTLEHALEVAETGADVVAVDGTGRPRPDGRTLVDVIQAIRSRTGKLVLADVSTAEEGEAAERAGADLVATTLAGYTSYSRRHDGPDLDLVRQLKSRVGIPVLAEGRIGTPEQARRAIEHGAWAVVVGTAITDPAAIASSFLREMRSLPVEIAT
jgi:N-acylglucosamine-6-phosphate 2-epimerase